MKKINAVISLLSMIVLVIHMTNAILIMRDVVEPNNFFEIVPIFLIVLISMHVLLSCYFVFIKGRKFKNPYIGLNIGTIIQRVTGLLFLVGIIIHVVYGKVSGTNGTILETSATLLIDKTPRKIEMVIIAIVSFIGYLHLCNSIEKGLMTLGIDNEKIIKFIKLVLSILLIYIYYIVLKL